MKKQIKKPQHNLQITVETTKDGLILNAYERRDYIDTWFEAESNRPGYVLLRSVRAKGNFWVPKEGDPEHSAVIEFARRLGVRHPRRFA